MEVLRARSIADGGVWEEVTASLVQLGFVAHWTQIISILHVHRDRAIPVF